MPFPTPFGRRISYDLDGSSAWIQVSPEFGGGWQELHPNAVAALNSSQHGGMSVLITSSGTPISPWGGAEDGVRRYGILFPQPYDISGVFFQGVYDRTANVFGSARAWEGSKATMFASSDTTNFLDGKWSQVPVSLISEKIPGSVSSGPWENYPPPLAVPVVDSITGEQSSVLTYGSKDAYRARYDLQGYGQRLTSLQEVSGVIFEVFLGTYINRQYEDSRLNSVIHLYGGPSEISGDRLSVVENSGNLRAALGWGDVRRDSSGLKEFRIRNDSLGKTARNVTVRVLDESMPPIPLPSQQLTLSLPGDTPQEEIEISEIAPGDLSGTIKLHRHTTELDVLGSQSPRVVTSVGEWL